MQFAVAPKFKVKHAKSRIFGQNRLNGGATGAFLGPLEAFLQAYGPGERHIIAPRRLRDRAFQALKEGL